MRPFHRSAGVTFVALLIGCAGSSPPAAGPARSLLAPAALSPDEAAKNAAALAHVSAEQVTITHSPTGIVAVESRAMMLITPDEKRMLTVTDGEVKWWSLADGSLLQAARVDLKPFPWAKPIYVGIGGYTSGFERGVSVSPFERAAFFSDDGQVATVRQHDRSNNYRFDARTGGLVEYPTNFKMPEGFVAVNGNRYAIISAEDRYGLEGPLSYKIEVGHTDRYETKSFPVYSYSELGDRERNFPFVPRATIAGYDSARNAVYLTRVNMQLQWELDAFDMAEEGTGRRQEVAAFADFSQYGHDRPDSYVACKATLSADSRYAACVLQSNRSSPIVRVVDLTSGKALGDVGPAGMRDPRVTSFADGLLTITAQSATNTAEPPRVLTFHLPDLKQVESMQLNQPTDATNTDAAGTTIAAVSPSHRYVVVSTAMAGEVASLTVYDLVAGKAMVLDDDVPTRQFAAKSNAAVREAYAALPAELAKQEQKAKMAVEDRINMERAVRELTLPPVYAPPPAPLFQRYGGSANAEACSYCGGSGVTIETNTTAGYSDTYQTDHGWEKAYHPKSTNISTSKCLHCNGSGRASR